MDMDMVSRKSANREKTLVKNTLIYSVGNIAAKLISVLLYPLYTHYVDPSELGYFDITLTIVFLVLPLYTFQLRDGVLRFILEADDDRKQSIYKYVFRRIAFNTLWLIVFAVVLNFIYSIPYLHYLLLLIIINGLLELEVFILRVESKKYYIIANIVSVFFTLLFSCLFLMFLNMNVEGIYLGNMLGRFIALIVIEFKFKFLSSTLFNKKVQVQTKLNKEILRYSIMLIPLAVNGAVIDIICKLFIERNLGLDENGIFSVATKFSTILLFLSIMFNQAWQETAIVEYRTPNKDHFFSDIYNKYLFLLSLLVGLICIGIKIFYPLIIAETYWYGLKYIYPLLMGVVFLALVSFLDIGYQCAKRTSKSILATVCSIMVCIVANFLLVPSFGLYGASIAYCLTYIFLFIYRFYDTKRFFIIQYNHIGYLSIVVFIIAGYFFYYINNVYILLISGALYLSLGLSFCYYKTNIFVKNG